MDDFPENPKGKKQVGLNFRDRRLRITNIGFGFEIQHYPTTLFLFLNFCHVENKEMRKDENKDVLRMMAWGQSNWTYNAHIRGLIRQITSYLLITAS